MIILITGPSHTGKTRLAQKILEKYKYPYFSLDLLKMGVIRSGRTTLTPEDDEALQAYLWPVVREMIKTAIENEQNLVVEGGYIPFGWEADFSDASLKKIRYCCLVMSRRYIENHFDDIKAHACVIENRHDDSWCTKEFLIEDNAHYLAQCRQFGYTPILIDETYCADIPLTESALFQAPED